jgi:hypothetical protein
LLKPTLGLLFPAIVAMYMPTCAPAVRPTLPPPEAHIAELWQKPLDLTDRDTFYGPWGATDAPDPHATYSFVRKKEHGVNPGLTVSDPQGREWHVKQAPQPAPKGAEGPIEVVLSRVLSAVGYHQPPVYFVPSFTLVDAAGTHVERGGRFRLHGKGLKDVGQWSWQQNPFVGTKPYQGLLVILMMFNSSDLKNDNNVLYDVRTPRDGVDRWYVVRDLGTALGETGRINPKRDDPDLFDRLPFVTGVKRGFVEFDYHGWHQELFHHISPDDVRWASELLAGLTDRQWSDAFRAGDYDPAVADRFVGRLHQKIAEGRRLGGTASSRNAPALPLPRLAVGARR